MTDLIIEVEEEIFTVNNVNYRIDKNFLKVKNRDTNQYILIIPTNRIINIKDAHQFETEK